jgi:aspartate aminotransferase
MQSFLEESSWIRKMFEEGTRLKEKCGSSEVFDFSLGNPNLEPPSSFYQSLNRAIDERGPGQHTYMPNAGYYSTRDAVARNLSMEYGVPISCDEVIMTCGAAGALNVIFKAIIDPGDEVVVPSPYFPEYRFYIDNHGGVLKLAETNSDFSLSIETISQNINERTKAVLINSPNNPTGQIYSEGSLRELGQVLTAASTKHNRIIYLISDEPYRKLVYDGGSAPSILIIYKNSIVANSYSKTLSLAGERIGYLVINPGARFRDELISAMILANRILGFVNAPALMQRIVRYIHSKHVDIEFYRTKRDLLCRSLLSYGYDLFLPKGAFYVFPRSPIPDDLAFVKILQEENILTVPGSGFGGPGHFRIAFCVDDATINGALPRFKRVAQRFGLRG